MKLKKIERYYNKGKLHSRWFTDENSDIQGYSIWLEGTKDKCYWVNDEPISFEIMNNKKLYYI